MTAVIEERTSELRGHSLPELKLELAKMRRILERIPEGRNDFKLHEQPATPVSLANHMNEWKEADGAEYSNTGSADERDWFQP